MKTAWEVIYPQKEEEKLALLEYYTNKMSNALSIHKTAILPYSNNKRVIHSYKQYLEKAQEILNTLEEMKNETHI